MKTKGSLRNGQEIWGSTQLQQAWLTSTSSGNKELCPEAGETAQWLATQCLRDFVPSQRTSVQFLAPTSDCSQPLAIPKLQGTQYPLTSTGYQDACGVCKCIQAHTRARKNKPTNISEEKENCALAMQTCYLASRVPGEGRIRKFTVRPGFVFSGCPSPQSFSTA